MDNEHYERLRAKIEAAYRADIAALDRLRAADERLSEEPGSSVSPPIPVAPTIVTHAKEQPAIRIEPALSISASRAPRTVGKGDVSNAILLAAQDLPATFNVNQVIGKIQELRLLADVKESSVRQAICRVAEAGKLSIVKQGAGRAPSIYRLPVNPIPVSELTKEMEFNDV